MVVKHCAICGKKEKVKVLFPENFQGEKITSQTFSARRTPDRIHHQFVQCLNCGLIFSTPIMDREEISKLYSQSIFTYQVESQFLRKTYGKYLRGIIHGKNPKKVAFLDIGCGNGFFLREARDMGIINVNGVEPGRKSVENAEPSIRKKIKIDFFRTGLYPRNFFDIVTCFHTLDHIIDPNKFLQDVYNNLKRSGKVLFVVHDTKGLSVQLFGEKSPIFDIEHMYLFNKTSLRTLFEKNGFHNCRVFSVANTYPLSYWVRMIPLPTIIKGPLIKCMKMGVGRIPLTVSAGNIGIIAEK